MTLENALAEAERGKAIVESIVSDYKKNYVVLVFPDKHKELFSAALKHYESFVSNYEYVYFLSSVDIEAFLTKTHIPYEEKKITEEEMNDVMRYLSLVTFSSLKILSISRPEHIKAGRLIGKKDATLEDIVVRCLFGVKGKL